MKKWMILFGLFFCVNALAATSELTDQALQAKLTPAQIVQRLKEGNFTFKRDKGDTDTGHRDRMKQGAIYGQFPLAFVLACIDSRSIPEIVFDQTKGETFTARIAGNVVEAGELGSMEFAVGYAGSKVIVIMGHTQCGAVKAACESKKNFKGNLRKLLAKLTPAVRAVRKRDPNGRCDDPKFINEITKENVRYQIKQTLKRSRMIRRLVKEKKVIIIGAIHNIRTGKVTFFDSQ